MNTPQKQTDRKSTVVVRGIMYACVAAVILMDLVPQHGSSGPSYGTYVILAVLVVGAELILWHDRRNPGFW